MTKTQKIISLSSALATVMAVSPLSVFAQLNDSVDINTNGEFSNLQNIKPSGFIRAAISILLGVAGVAAFIFLLWGGLSWILAGGDKDGTEKARKRITAALVGLAIVFSAYALIFIIRALFGIDIIGVNLQSINSY
jgi:hypothetical protein